jgi:hypothetical protein
VTRLVRLVGLAGVRGLAGGSACAVATLSRVPRDLRAPISSAVPTTVVLLSLDQASSDCGVPALPLLASGLGAVERELREVSLSGHLGAPEALRLGRTPSGSTSCSNFERKASRAAAVIWSPSYREWTM